MSTLQVNTIQTNTPAGVLAVRDSNDALTSIQPSALRGTAVLTPPLFQDSAGTPIGTLCRAWVRIVSSATPSVAAGFNVSSITYLSTGNWRVNFTNAMPTVNYVGFVTFDGNYNITSGMVGQTTTAADISVKVNTTGGPGFNPGTLFVGFFA
jgi:hypothetical protein